MNSQFTQPIDDLDLFSHLFSLNNTKLLGIFDQQAHALREMAMQFGEVDPQSISNTLLTLLLIARRSRKRQTATSGAFSTLDTLFLKSCRILVP